ncbi:MAG: long-chain fatty acid--CoA ligase, partial [Pseudomonadota bacterium]
DADGIGEIWIRGENIMLGYYRDPERSREALTDDGWLRSGDLGRIDADGAVFIAGRSKELIIRSGFNVYPPEIEDMLTRHPAVYQAAVIGRAVPGNEEIVAFVLTDGAVTADTVHAWLRERLVAYKLPQRLVIVDSFPTAATGKILKHKLLGTFADCLSDAETTARASAE